MPEHETGRPWLVALLQAYAFLDEALRLDIARRGRIPACRSGCEACCHQPIPISPPEIMAIRLFLNQTEAPHTQENDAGDMAERLRRSCPFIEQGTCRIYPVRPFACRRFIVFGQPCRRGEDPTRTRPDDVLRPSRHALLHALRMTMPFYAALQGGAAAEPLPEARQASMDFFLSRTIVLQQTALF